MKKEDILNILNEEIMIVEDQAGNKITCIESCDFDDIADAILRMRGVVSSNVFVAHNTTNKHLTNGKAYEIHHNCTSENAIWVKNDINKIACYSKKNFK